MEAERLLATVLFTDIVGSTERATELGDRAYRGLLHKHHALVRRALDAFGGQEISTTGDGFLALFSDPERAICCACAVRDGVRKLGLEVRAGLHMGEVERAGRNLGGIAVHIGARVAAQAADGEVLVSNTVRDLVEGSGFGFDDRGSRVLKGVRGEWRLFAVTNCSVETRLRRASGWRRRIGRRQAILVGLLGSSLLLGLVTLQMLRRDRGSAPARRAAEVGDSGAPAVEVGAAPGIAVLPFQVNPPALEPWREGMVDLLSVNLDGIPGLRAIDSRTVLARWRERTPTGIADLATTLEGARRTGARYAVVGSVVAIGPDVRFVAEVYDASAGKLGVAQVQGSPDSVFALVDHLSVEILRLLLPKTGSDFPRVDLAAVTTRSLTALKAWLEGERLLRRSDFQGAVSAYQRAIEADSTFVLPLLRLASPQGFGSASEGAISHRLAALIDRLRPRDALVVHADLLLASDDPQDKLRGLELLKEASRRYPDNPDIWYQLGETLFHAGPHVAEGIDFEENDRAFSSAIELDSSYAPAYIHPLQNAFSLADSARAADLIRAYRRLSPDVVAEELSFALGFGDSATRLEARAALDTVPTLLLHRVAGNLTHPRFRTVEEEVLERLLRRPDVEDEVRLLNWYARLGSGKLRQALEPLDDPAAELMSKGSYAYFPYTMGVPVPPARLDRDLVLDESDSLSAWATFYVGAYAADRRRWAEHAKAVSLLRAHSSRSQDIAPGWGQSMAEALEGYALWRRGRKDEALRRIEVAEARTMLFAMGWSGWLAHRTVTTWHGRLLLELGRPREAVPYFKTMFSGLAPDPLDSYYLGRAYEAANQPQEARRAYEYFAAAWKDADPELRPMVEEARAAAARLTGVIQE